MVTNKSFKPQPLKTLLESYPLPDVKKFSQQQHQQHQHQPFVVDESKTYDSLLEDVKKFKSLNEMLIYLCSSNAPDEVCVQVMTHLLVENTSNVKLEKNNRQTE